MITKLKVIETKNTHPYRNLAIEEYMTLHVQEEECILFLWQNNNTVVIGRNQNIWQECKTDTLQADGGYPVRRLSGGGAVYHDMGNLNFTFIVRKADYDVKRQLEVIVRAIENMGVNVKYSGRNDILIQGKKFSGNAFYNSGDFCYHHGTLLLRSDFEKMKKYLNVSSAKLASKSVASVQARVANLADYIPDITVALMNEKLCAAFSEVYGCPVENFDETKLPAKEIDAMEQRFSSEEWIYGRKAAFNCTASHRFAWGDICLQLLLEQGRIKNARVYSDAMQENFAPELEHVLEGCAYNQKTLFHAVDRIAIDADNLDQLKMDTKELIQSMT